MAHNADANPRHAAARSAGWALRLQQVWLTRGPAALALLPLALLYGLLYALNRSLYRMGLRRVTHVAVPVVVVGNLVAGGGGKTPVVLALAQALQRAGFRLGVVSRGYGRAGTDCREVLATDSPDAAGDEPLLLRQRLGVPVFVARRRANAARQLLHRYPDTDVILCDDGLQHFALHHDLSVCVLDDRGLGNGWLLPAGPLRERGVTVDWALSTRPLAPTNALSARSGSFVVTRRLAVQAHGADGRKVPLANCTGQPAAAVAGIARPAAFFAMLRDAGIHITHAVALPDHYNFDSWKPLPDMPKLLFCTEKDAQKLWRQVPQALAVPLELDLPIAFVQQFVPAVRQQMQGRRQKTGAAGNQG